MEMLTDKCGVGLIHPDEVVDVGWLRKVNVYIVRLEYHRLPSPLLRIARSLMIAGWYTTL